MVLDMHNGSSTQVLLTTAVIIVIIVAPTILDARQRDACHGRIVESNRLICICDEDQCGDLKLSWPEEFGQAIWVRSSRSGLRFETYYNSSRSEVASLSLETVKINVDLKDRRQSILGWGGAFTDAFGFNLNKLSKSLASKLIYNYYGENGLQYNFGRVPIGGSDFSLRPYSYDDSSKADYSLRNWTLPNEDRSYKINQIKAAMAMVEARSSELKLFGSPWTPPRWMKDNNNFVRGHLIHSPKIYESYADYLMKFYRAYKKHGIKFWGATIQNEPIASQVPVYFFNSLQMSSSQTIEFISKYLGPALEAEGYTKENFKLMVGDDSLGLINLQVPAIMRNESARKYISGLAFHWYASGITVPYSALNLLYDEIKDHIEFVMMTEACRGSQPFEKKVDLGSWERGESYASDIIEDLRRHTGAWIDWNMALDTEGGPNWAKNFVDSPIIVNATRNEFIKQPMYYALAHFSRFFKPGSIFVATTSDHRRSQILPVSVLIEESGHVAVNILNKRNNRVNLEVTVQGIDGHPDGLKLDPFTIEGKSINSVAIKI